MKAYISPLGFDTSHILSLIVKYGIEAEDSIILLMSNKTDERAESAFSSVKEMIHKIDSRISVDRIMLNNDDFSGMIVSCIKAIKNASNEKPDTSVMVNLSGGPRELLVALTIASVSNVPYITKATCYSDVCRQLSQIELPYFTSPLQDRELAVLRDIKMFGPTSISDVATRLQISESSISRYCTRLLLIGLIDLTAKGKRKFAKIKPCAEVVLATTQKE